MSWRPISCHHRRRHTKEENCGAKLALRDVCWRADKTIGAFVRPRLRSIGVGELEPRRHSETSNRLMSSGVSRQLDSLAVQRRERARQI